MTTKHLAPALVLLFASYGAPACSQEDPDSADRSALLEFDVVDQSEDAWTVVVTEAGTPVGAVHIGIDGNLRVEAEGSTIEASLVDETLLWAFDGPTGHESAVLPIAALEAAFVADGPAQLAQDVALIGEQTGPGSREHRVAFMAVAIRGAAEAVGHAKLGRASVRLVDIATATAAKELGLLNATDVPATPDELRSPSAPVSDCNNGCEVDFLPDGGYCGVCCDEDQWANCGADWWGPYCYCEAGGGGGGGGDGALEPSHW